MSVAETYLRRSDATGRGGLVPAGLPSAGEVLVDGPFAGLAEAFGVSGGTMNLDAGAHHIELRAPGYQTTAFSVMIEPNSLVRYRGEMPHAATTPAAAVTPAPAPPTAVAAKSVYVIPGCY